MRYKLVKLILIVIIATSLTGCASIFEFMDEMEEKYYTQPEVVVDKVEELQVAPEYLTASGVLVYEETEIKETSMKVELNGKAIMYDPKYNQGDDSEIKIILFRERSLIPLRELAEELGYTIYWEGAGTKQTLYIEGNDLTMITLLNSNEFIIKKDGKTQKVYTETPNVKYEGKIYVPLRFIGETFGLEVNWLESEFKVELKIEEGK